MTRTRRTAKQKLSAVLAADMVGVVAAAEQTGIPESSIRYWRDDPRFAEYRAKAREEMAEEVEIVAHLAWRRLAEALLSGSLEPRDALFAADKATTLLQLLSGQATHRTESKSIADGLDDHERALLKEKINEALKVEQ